VPVGEKARAQFKRRLIFDHSERPTHASKLVNTHSLCTRLYTQTLSLDPGTGACHAQCREQNEATKPHHPGWATKVWAYLRARWIPGSQQTPSNPGGPCSHILAAASQCSTGLHMLATAQNEAEGHGRDSPHPGVTQCSKRQTAPVGGQTTPQAAGPCTNSHQAQAQKHGEHTSTITTLLSC
jgi:hypothetical protein